MPYYLTPKRSTAVSIAQTHNKLISIQLLTLLLLNNTAYNLIDTNLFVVCKYLLKLTPMTIENLFRQMKIRISNWSNKKKRSRRCELGTFKTRIKPLFHCKFWLFCHQDWRPIEVSFFLIKSIDCFFGCNWVL